MLEKPFGRSLDTCSQLMGQLSMLRAHETFYIDHYLGKELVMNLLVLRFANVRTRRWPRAASLAWSLATRQADHGADATVPTGAA